MPITIRPEGEAALYAQAGQAIGRAQKAERKEQLAFQREQALIEVAERRRQQQAAKDWDLQKMLLNSQQDFAHEQRLRQVELNREARAKEWEFEKMQLRSQIDFETEERKRQKEYDEFLTTDKYINDKVASGEWTPERAEGPLFMNAYKHESLGKPEIAARLGSSPEYVQRLKTGRSREESPLEALLKASGQEGITPGIEQPRVWVYAPNGKLAQVPADQVEEAIAEGAQLAPGQQLPKSPAFQEAQTQWMIEQQLLKGDKGYILAELDNAYKVAYSPAIDPKNPFASLIAQSKIADIRKKYPAYFEEYARQYGGQLTYKGQ